MIRRPYARMYGERRQYGLDGRLNEQQKTELEAFRVRTAELVRGDSVIDDYTGTVRKFTPLLPGDTCLAPDTPALD